MTRKSRKSAVVEVQLGRTIRHASMETFERRDLLAATVTSGFAAESLAGSQTISVPLAAHFVDPSLTPGDTTVDIDTNLPAPANQIPVQLTSTATPLTVAFFLKYITTGEYADTLFHRLASGFVLQGGNFTASGKAIKSLGDIPDEASTAMLQNTFGTISTVTTMGEGTATSGFFFNLGNNTNLDPDLFTPFGKVIYGGANALDAINKLPTVDDLSNTSWTTLPVQKYTGKSGATVSSVPSADLVTINPVTVPGGLMYSVASSNASVAKVSISNGNVSIVGGIAGTATVTVTATDLGGGKASTKFTVTVQRATTISGHVYSDNNGNGKLDAGEPGLAGVKVFVDTNKNGKLDSGEMSTTTNSAGVYSFTDLSAGTYHIVEVVPTGYRLTSPTAGYFSVTAVAGTTVTAGNFLDAPAPGTISGRVFADANGNGRLDPGEPGLGLWTVYLDLNKDGVLDAGDIQTTTDIYGDWVFNDLAPGTYNVRIVPVSGLKLTTPTVLSVTVEAGVTVVGNLFGEEATS